MKEYKAYIEFTPVPDHSSKRILWSWTTRVYAPASTRIVYSLSAERLYTSKEDASVDAKEITTAYTKAYNEENYDEFTIEVD